MDTLKNISIVFMSIFFESLPFLLLGSLISAVIEHFVSDDIFEKVIPKNKILGTIVGILLGFFLPACDCAVIPVSKRLIKKKVPLNVVVSFMLASPIINPVVLLSTYKAFYKTNPELFYYRIILGILVSFIIGLIMGIIFKNKPIIKRIKEEEEICACNHEKGLKHSLVDILKHTSYDLYEVIKYLIFGALLASLIQVLMPRSILLIFNNNEVLSIIVLMIFAYLISLCSTSDSFVGKSLLTIFGKTSIMAYLLLGPMIDIKNTIVLFGNYKRKYVTVLIFVIFIIIFITSLIMVKVL